MVASLIKILSDSIEEHLKAPPQNIDEMREHFRQQSEATLREMFKDRTEEYKVDCWLPTGYELQRSNNQVVVWFVRPEEGKRYKARTFTGNRLARVYGKRSWRDTLVSDVLFRPIKPVEHITLNFTIQSENNNAV